MHVYIYMGYFCLKTTKSSASIFNGSGYSNNTDTYPSEGKGSTCSMPSVRNTPDQSIVNIGNIHK